MTTQSTKTLADAFFAALPTSNEQATTDKRLINELHGNIIFHKGADAANALRPLTESLLPLLRRHPTKVTLIGGIIAAQYGITAERITRRIEGTDLTPSANHYTHVTGNIDDLTTLITAGKEPVTDIDRNPITTDRITRALSPLTNRDISLTTYALRSAWITPNQAWDVVSRNSVDSNIISECILLASKLTDLTYRDTTLVQVVRGMRNALNDHDRSVYDPLDLSTDEKLDQNAAIARATILAAAEDIRYNRTPDLRLIRNRRTQSQSMHGIHLHEEAINLYRWYPTRHHEITQLLIVDGWSIMRVQALLQTAEGML